MPKVSSLPYVFNITTIFCSTSLFSRPPGISFPLVSTSVGTHFENSKLPVHHPCYYKRLWRLIVHTLRKHIRIAIVKNVFRTKIILINILVLWRRIMFVHIWLVLPDESEIWTVARCYEKRKETSDEWCYRNMPRTIWIEILTN